MALPSNLPQFRRTQDASDLLCFFRNLGYFFLVFLEGFLIGPMDFIDNLLGSSFWCKNGKKGFQHIGITEFLQGGHIRVGLPPICHIDGKDSELTFDSNRRNKRSVNMPSKHAGRGLGSAATGNLEGFETFFSAYGFDNSVAGTVWRSGGLPY